MSKGDELKSRINLGPKPQKSSSESGGEVPVPRVKPIRITSDLSPIEYRKLTDFAAETAQSLNRPRVPIVEVNRALLAELHSDSDLAERIKERIKNQLN